MKKGRNPYGVVLAALRERIAGGDLPPGEPLPILEIAQEFGFSTTPVREALVHLAGEGLIEEVRGQGYAARSWSAAGLLGLYRTHELHVLAALDWAAGPENGGAATARVCLRPALQDRLRAAEAARDQVVAAGWLFQQLVARSHTRALQRIHSVLNAQLGAVRRAENVCLDGIAEELERIAGHHDKGDAARLRCEILAYHTRRREAVLKIIGRLGRERTDTEGGAQVHGVGTPPSFPWPPDR